MERELSNSHTIHHRVRYSECDRMGYLYHVNHFEFLEWGRTEWFRSKFMAYRDIEDKGYAVVVVDAKLRYLKPGYYDDLISITTRISNFKGSRFEFAYVIKRISDGAVICEAETSHCFVNKMGKPLKIFPEFKELLNSFSNY